MLTLPQVCHGVGVYVHTRSNHIPWALWSELIGSAYYTCPGEDADLNLAMEEDKHKSPQYCLVLWRIFVGRPSPLLRLCHVWRKRKHTALIKWFWHHTTHLVYKKKTSLCARTHTWPCKSALLARWLYFIRFISICPGRGQWRWRGKREKIEGSWCYFRSRVQILSVVTQGQSSQRGKNVWRANVLFWTHCCLASPLTDLVIELW